MGQTDSKGNRHFKKTMTDKALEANKNNARKSTGPKSQRDIKTIQPNMKHGILAKIPVIPGIENQEEWDQFVIDLKLSLKPEGVLENTLVESVANYFWKKRRLLTYENNKIKYKIDEIKAMPNKIIKSYYELLYKDPTDFVDPDKPKLEELKSNIKDLEDSQKAFDNYTNWPDDKDMEVDDAGFIVGSVLELIYTLKKNSGEEIPNTPYELFDVESVIKDFWNPEKSATLKQVTKILSKIGKEFGYSISELEWLTRIYIGISHKSLVKKTEEIEQSLEILINDELYENKYTENVMKLDAQLNRSILQTLHELQRLQAMRVGISGPPEAIDITGIENI